MHIYTEREREREKERYFVYTSSECLFACNHVTMSRQKEKGGCEVDRQCVRACVECVRGVGN
jgi:hypothetical protein